VAESVLVVDDDPTVTEIVAAYLDQAGFAALVAPDGPSALEMDRAHDPDLIVLDLMMPGIDGLEVCRRVRLRRPRVPIVMVTARGEEDDRIAGLEAGADDYVVKPFSPKELVLRVRSVLRRAAESSAADHSTDPESLVDGDLVVRPHARTAALADQEVVLTTREFDLLVHFLTHPGVAFSREQLLADVWGWDFGDQSTVTVHVRRLREKIEADPAQPRRIATVWGTGYRWDPQP
jgi:two-component system response regulator ResD